MYFINVACSLINMRISFSINVSRYVKVLHKRETHQWRSGSALKDARREVSGSSPGRACRPSQSEFSAVLSENRINTDQDHLERPPKEGAPLIVPGSTSGRLDSKPRSIHKREIYMHAYVWIA